jgi:formate hydrogenlyase subunit 4
VIAEIGIALVQMLVVGAAAPLLVGVLRALKAKLVGRQGPRVWQPYADLAKLLGKEPVVSPTTSWIFRATPYLLAVIALTVATAVPVVAARPGLPFTGNLFVIMSLFLLGTFFLALAGLDAGSAFGGMGSSREVAVAALAEPTIILAIFALALQAGTTDLDGIVEHLVRLPQMTANPGHLLAFAAFFIVMIAETGRLPVDNPATHLELTMIHEAMVLEYSGHYLALIEWAGAMKLFLFMTLLANLFFPWGLSSAGVGPGALLMGLAALLLKLALLTAALALLETAVAKLRLFRVPELLAGSFALALLSVTSVFVLR